MIGGAELEQEGEGEGEGSRRAAEAEQSVVEVKALVVAAVFG